MSAFMTLTNGEVVHREDVPLLSLDAFRATIVEAAGAGDRLAALPGQPLDNGKLRLTAVLARDRLGELAVGSADVGETYPALTPECAQASGFEREIAEQWGVTPQGHPWLKPLRYHRSYRDRDAWGRAGSDRIEPSVTDFFAMEGEEIHDVAVGPVHAGVIEPGHFRFQCHGEDVFHLEISLGYQHRGVERALLREPGKRVPFYMETLAGDTTIGHATAWAHAVESLRGIDAPPRAHSLRAIALELERLANHTGDLGALAGDVGYLPTASYCGRIRGDFLNMTALLCGSRFGRGLVRPGGVLFDLEPERANDLLQRLDQASKDVTNAVELLWSAPSVLARFEETGVVPPSVCRELGLVGPPARACGFEHDVRQDFPVGIYRFYHIPVSTWSSGDVFGRAFVRCQEIQRSVAFVREQIGLLPDGAIRASDGPCRADRLTISLIEGWRGEICHVATTDSAGRVNSYKVTDPSFHNWMGLAIALRNQQISDFPLCNKSFNLSYCGHDL